MNCREAQELLSAYHDGELSTGMRSSVAEHVEGCSGCSGELAAFARLSAMAKGLDSPEPPQAIWANIESALDIDREGAVLETSVGRAERSEPRRQRFDRNWRGPLRSTRPTILGLVTTAALVLVSAGVVWMATRTGPRPGHRAALAANFERYLDEFATSPETAQDVLLASYRGRSVDINEATRQLGYRPAIAAGVPEGYSVEAMYVLEMPCCRCLQAICRRGDGTLLAVFEHDEEQPLWFGDRPRIETQCNGRACSLVQADRTLVASWKAGRRQLTVVGVSGLEDVAGLISHLQGGNRNT